MIRKLLLLSLLLFGNSSHATSSCEKNNIYEIGTGIFDITGPAAEEGMMGYGMLGQQTAGILQRLWARAFVIASPCNNKRIVFVNVDLGQIFQGIKQQVIVQLQKKYGNLYTDENVLLTATHTHSGPGGYSTYTFYNITTLGFSHKNFNTIVEGIVNAVSFAHDHLQKAQLTIAKGDLPNISFNRSPQAYALNPKAERHQYQNNVDTEMTLLRIDNLENKPLGLINWFAIHGVSMNNKNHLINGDNKGYAAYLFEKDFASDYSPTAFIAAFAQANAGDVSPNPYGFEGGMGEVGLKAIENAGKPQYQIAKHLFNHGTISVKGEIDYKHTFIKMDEATVAAIYTNGSVQKTCPAAIGMSMLAGTQDGEGIGWQGISCLEFNQLPVVRLMCALVTTACQGVKPIAIPTGNMKPYPWTPNILPLQIFKIGQLIIAAVPFEITTMTGRRIKETIAKQFSPDHIIVLSTLANAYAGYVATQEEYQMQRYEGASTHFGPWTAALLQQELAQLAKALVSDTKVAPGPTPLDLSHSQIDLQPGVIFDDKPWGKQFGDLYQDVHQVYKPGETVKVVFWGAHPKNNYRIQNINRGFLAVQYLNPTTGVWETIRHDYDWDTEYQWTRNGVAYSLISIIWRIPTQINPGSYRILHFGDYKTILGKIYPYKGSSSEFKIA